MASVEESRESKVEKDDFPRSEKESYSLTAAVIISPPKMTFLPPKNNADCTGTLKSADLETAASVRYTQTPVGTESAESLLINIIRGIGNWKQNTEN